VQDNPRDMDLGKPQGSTPRGRAADIPGSAPAAAVRQGNELSGPPPVGWLRVAYAGTSSGKILEDPFNCSRWVTAKPHALILEPFSA